METLEVIKKCENCGAKVIGRTDKRFCDNECRTEYNNQKTREKVKQMPECIARIQKTIINNYNILTTLKSRSEQFFSKMYLMELGFSFRYVTSAIEQEGTIWYFCFNQAYIITGDRIMLLAETEPVNIH